MQHLSEFEIARLRSDTPGVALRPHFNNAGAALMPKPVAGGMISDLEREAAIGGYEAATESFTHLERVYDSVAQLVESTREEIALAENALVLGNAPCIHSVSPPATAF